MTKQLISGIRPSRFHYQRIRVFYQMFRPVVKKLFSPIVRISVEGREHIPRRGPILVLANHVGFFDPFVLNIALGRPIHFMATHTVFQKKLLSLVAYFFGVVPKMKFLPDIRSIFKLMDWSALGAAIGLFPEGKRSWDGRANDILPGIGKLVKLLRIPVVTIRIVNADRLSPRWALKQRRGRITVSIDPPRYLHHTSDPKEIEAEIGSATMVDIAHCRRDPVYGRNFALGITNVLFLCPACFSMESLSETGDLVRCTACNKGWRVGHDNYLTATDSNSRIPLFKAIDSINQALGRRGWVGDIERFRSDGVLLESRELRPYETNGTRRHELGVGKLLLTRDSLSFIGTVARRIPLLEIQAATVDIVHEFQFRTESSLFEVTMADESVVKWDVFVNHWMTIAQSNY